MPSPRTLQISCLAAAGFACLLPSHWGTALAVLATLAWLSVRPPRRVLMLALPLVAAAMVLLLAEYREEWIPEDVRLERAASILNGLLAELDTQADEAASSLPKPAADRAGRQRAFESLRRLAAASEPAEGDLRRSWVLFDPDGEAVAWAGRGLLHEVAGETLPRSGRVHIGSFTANTFLSLASLEAARRPWRVGVGVSVSADSLPGWSDSPVQWALLDALAVPEAGARLVEVGDLRLAIREAGGGPRHVRPVGPRRWAALLLAAAVAVSGAMRLAAHGSSGSPSVIAFLAAAVLASLAWPLSPWLFAPFGLGLVLGALPPRGSQPGSAAWRSLWGIQASVLAVVSLAASGLLLRLDPSLDLGSVFFGTPEAVVLRVSLFTLVIGSLRWIRGGGGNHLPSRWGLVGMAVLMIAAAIHGWTLGGLALLLLGTYFAVAWAKQGGWSEPGVGVVTGCLLAALIAAIAWELAYHQALERRLRAVVEDELAPPSTVELEDVAASAAAFFDELALESLTVGDPQALEPEDLAFAVWRQSPLAQIGRLSRVVVGPPDAPLSSFAYGVPAARVGQLDDATQRRTASELPGWEGASIVGRGSLTLGAGSWTTVEYRLFLRPGFRSGGSVLSTLAEGLLRRRSDLLADLPELPADVLLGVYGADGSVLVPPWKGAVDLQRSAVPARLLIPGGWARTFVDEEAGVKRVLLLPIPTPLTGIERVATHAAGPLILVLTAGALWFVFSLSEVTRRRAVRLGWRSFSTRLVVLYTVLLIVPIVLINVLVLRVFAERLEREQRAASEAALESAQRILGDYVFSLEPGFGLETAVGDDVLVWLSHVVHHEVNLYWGSRLSASSKGELFSSGLLPQRIPGEVFARIALEGADLASRTTRAGGAVYEEFYAPLEAPGAPLDDAGLFVSTPLLAQEVAAAEDMAAIRRRVLLAGAAVALLLALLGRRVGTSFTRPLLKIVEGTQAIAAGAPSIEVEANDSELVTLVDAIDEMAQRIAAARSELLREKQVVDRMIDNITSGVVSVDHLGRVLLLNRTAHELLGITIGESLTDALGREDRLASVAAFVTAASDRLAQKTVSLSGLDDNEAEWTLIWVPLAGSGEPAALFVIEDVTEVLRGQRLEAWAEMARMIAHEVKNPLTPIRLSTEHLREVWRSGRGDLGRTLDQCTSNILRQVGELQQIVSDFSAYSRIPAINPRRGDLADLVERVVDGYRSGGPPVAFERLAGPWSADFDSKLLTRAVRNLLENAVRATREGGEVQVSVGGRKDQLEIRVADSGRGIATEHLARIFDPYFSTEDSGTGLGLPIARRIVEEHMGTIVARHRSPSGLEVIIRVPRAGDEALADPASELR